MKFHHFRIALLLIPLLSALAAQSQAIGIPGAAAKLMAGAVREAPSASQASPPPADSIAGIRGKLAAVNEELARAGAATYAGAANPEEIIDRELMLRQTLRFYQRQIDTLLKLDNFQKSRARFAKETANWTGFPTPPPYSFLMVDDLRESLRALQIRVDSLAFMDESIKQERERRNDLLEESSEKLRQATERLETTSSADPRQVWLRDLAATRNRMDRAGVEAIQMEQQANDEDLAESRQRLELFQRQLTEADKQVAFPAEDKDKVRKRLTQERQSLQAELDEMLPRLEESRRTLDAASEALDQERINPYAGTDARSRLVELEQRAEQARERTENADIKFQLLNRLLDSVRMRANIYELRWSLAGNWNSEDARKAYDKIANLQNQIKPIKQFVDQRLKLTTAQIFALEKRLLEPSSATSDDYLKQLREIYLEREADYRRILWGIDLSEELIEFWEQELADKRLAKPWRERFQAWTDQLSELAGKVWAVELFAVEDAIEVDGQIITGKRSVTLGKVARALLILVAGLWLSCKLAAAGERFAVVRGRLDASSARIARRWFLFVAGGALLMISMVMVKIPLTAFAFTGGALAIGAGFGMQNLLKNLISGLMLLWEHPFRPGDLVEVSGIRGRVMDIGMRSSHIRDANGIETLIPNSTFVEENVTNWTLSSQSVRFAVKLGVAYGTPTQKLAELLSEVASQHGLVQKKPPPQVLFEDFGSDALLFGLYVWVELRPGVEWPQVSSDLRYMINKALAAHGIVMAFPQRDLHVDAVEPLQVRVLRD